MVNKKLEQRFVDLIETDCYITQDTEHNHASADSFLCDLLIELGYKKVVKAYKKVDKWYA